MNNVLIINNKMKEINEITDGTSGDIPLEKTNHLSPQHPLLFNIDNNPSAIKTCMKHRLYSGNSRRLLIFFSSSGGRVYSSRLDAFEILMRIGL